MRDPAANLQNKRSMLISDPEHNGPIVERYALSLYHCVPAAGAQFNITIFVEWGCSIEGFLKILQALKIPGILLFVPSLSRSPSLYLTFANHL